MPEQSAEEMAAWAGDRDYHALADAEAQRRALPESCLECDHCERVGRLWRSWVCGLSGAGLDHRDWWERRPNSCPLTAVATELPH